MSHLLITPENTKILICCHKPSILPTDDLFLPLQVGKAISHYDLHIQGDDTCRGVPCNNISNKNDSYCELTGLYWAWKNIKTLYPNLKYLGLCHYRRYFSFSRIGLFSDSVDLPVSEIENYKIDRIRLSNDLQKDATIVAKQRVYPYPPCIDYSFWHIGDDYRSLVKTIRDLYPEYLSTTFSIMERGNRMSPYNMFIMPFQVVDAYCTWMFDVLRNVEPLIPYMHYNAEQKRVFGYLSEWLLNIWLIHNNIHCVYYPVIRFTEEKTQKNTAFYRGCKLIHYNLTSRMLYPKHVPKEYRK